MTYHISPQLSDWQKQIIFGTVLGGSSLIRQKNSKNCYLSMRGSNNGWIQYKAKQLDCLISPTPFFMKGGYFRWHSICSPILNNFYDIFYKDGKRKVEMNTLDIMRDIGLAVWFLDAGKIVDNQVIFNTRIHGPDGSKTISQYFEVIGLKHSIIGNGIKFTEEASKQFIVIIGGYMSI